jgi:3-oxoacyl-[acyl-carrier protein] reductase
VKAISVSADAASPDFGKDIVNATLKAFPDRKIDIIINNAAAVLFASSAFDYEGFDNIFHANVRGPLLLVGAALPHMASPGGRVISIGTVASRIGSRFAGLYAATKGALNTLTFTWAEELGPLGITANVVSPGPIGTDNVPPEEHELVKRFRSEQQIKRNGTVEEVAEVIVFIAGKGSGFVTGQVVGVDGGFSHA